MSETAGTPPPANDRRRVLAFVALSVVIAMVGTLYVLAAARDVKPARPAPVVGVATPGAGSVLFQNNSRDDHYGEIAMIGENQPSGPRTFTGLFCDRMHFAGKRGLCVAQDRTSSGFIAKTFDDRFTVRSETKLDGVPSRVRVSSDGRYGATTMFVLGHSYADGTFSTRETLFDLESGREIAHLEEFTTFRDGQRLDAPDVNYWGVTFAAVSNRFYTTVRTGNKTYLVGGDVAARRMTTLRENVECPSLSPDGARIAYKKRPDPGDATWRLHVLDLATMTDTPLAEATSIDDQVEWLDNGRVLYGALDASLYVTPADGSGAPTVFTENALSPAVVR